MKNYLKRIFLALIGRSVPTAEFRICFHKEAIYFGEHGKINVSNIKMGLVEVDVAFVFVGITTPPVLDLNTYTRIWEEAKVQGFIPHHITQYGKRNEVFDYEQIEDTIGIPNQPTVNPGVAATRHLQAISAASGINKVRG